MDPIVVVGAGVTGCVIAARLVSEGYKIILIEKDSRIGGLAKTFRYGDFIFDIGPHRFFTHKKRVYKFIKETLRGNYNIIPRRSDVFFLDKYYSWPLRPTVLFNLPLSTSMKSAWDLLLMGIRRNKKSSDTFEDYILKNYGPSLYNIFFKEYTEKFLGYSPSDVHSQWAKESMRRTIIDERIASRHLFDMLKLFFKFRPIRTEFIYPRGGTDIFCRNLAEEIISKGGEILTNTSIKYANAFGGKINQVYINGAKIDIDRIIWTGPLDAISYLLDVPCDGLEYLSLVVFNIELKSPIDKNFQWCYYGSRDIVFSRVTIPPVFSKNLAPEGTGSLCVEITCSTHGELWNDPQKYLDRVKSDLLKVGLIKNRDCIRKIHIEKIRNAYPIYKLDYMQRLKTVMGNLGKFENLRLAGRTALFWYNNMDDSIENGLEVADDTVKERDEILIIR
ncbi:MAG: FAD-dependent oxidoreductase [Candidatus Omnitrophica bacterium]|nr:FAD-dependent oxidoreductase [Candidatus Omnitrophota bacterium]